MNLAPVKQKICQEKNGRQRSQMSAVDIFGLSLNFVYTQPLYFDIGFCVDIFCLKSGNLQMRIIPYWTFLLINRPKLFRCRKTLLETNCKYQLIWKVIKFSFFTIFFESPCNFRSVESLFVKLCHTSFLTQPHTQFYGSFQSSMAHNKNTQQGIRNRPFENLPSGKKFGSLSLVSATLEMEYPSWSTLRNPVL